ncbi:hypothetical protein F0562_013436 [Nyssa sinensis]|uniref:RRM domain-containing protein n=1 Tax=Nyssa sinensis TaxID=561372 RepID=A0A5J4ZKF9_9ASTE|nr:hypothetical protein F0562_013436 [Nyssa sinensis]
MILDSFLFSSASSSIGILDFSKFLVNSLRSMDMEPGKLFIGGISWDTNEDRLREYFQTFGEVVEAVIMKDRTTGRARGFGFVVFADPAVAERVVREKHMIDGRTVEAKKAVPRDDQHMLNRNTGSIQGSPGPARTKKIFVDVVVMYDHNTQRPRGFGFITYDSEEAVEKVLLKTFHELNGKMVEVKRAVPKELSPGPSRNQLGGYNYGLSRVSGFLNDYTQGYNPSSAYGVRMDGRFSPVTVGRSGYPPYSPGYGMGLNLEPGSSNRYSSPVGYGGGSGGTGSVLSSASRNMWGNGSLNYATSFANSSDFLGSGSGNTGLVGSFGSIGAIWGSCPLSGQGGVTDSAYGSGNICYGSSDNSFGSRGGGYARNGGSSAALTSSYAAPNDGLDGVLGNFYGGGSFYGDPTWRSSSPELEGSGPFGYGLGNAASDVIPKNPAGYIGGYNVTNRSNRGIAA